MECQVCGRPFGKRKRCYYCQPAKRKTGETRNCKVCGKEFYAAKWQLDDTLNNQGVYCSRKCKHKAMEISGPGSRRQRKDGYIDVYYPKHPDSTKTGWMLEHRLVAETKYGHRIDRNTHIHHINGIKNDNRPENLEMIDASSHAGISNKRGQELRMSMRAELEEYRRLFGPIEEARKLKTITTVEGAIEQYYRIRSRGGKITLGKVAESTGFTEQYLRKMKVAYDKAGKWGSKPQEE